VRVSFDDHYQWYFTTHRTVEIGEIIKALMKQLPIRGPPICSIAALSGGNQILGEPMMITCPKPAIPIEEAFSAAVSAFATMAESHQRGDSGEQLAFAELELGQILAALACENTEIGRQACELCNLMHLVNAPPAETLLDRLGEGFRAMNERVFGDAPSAQKAANIKALDRIKATEPKSWSILQHVQGESDQIESALDLNLGGSLKDAPEESELMSIMGRLSLGIRTRSPDIHIARPIAISAPPCSSPTDPPRADEKSVELTPNVELERSAIPVPKAIQRPVVERPTSLPTNVNSPSKAEEELELSPRRRFRRRSSRRCNDYDYSDYDDRSERSPRRHHRRSIPRPEFPIVPVQDGNGYLPYSPTSPACSPGPYGGQIPQPGVLIPQPIYGQSLSPASVNPSTTNTNHIDASPNIVLNLGDMMGKKKKKGKSKNSKKLFSSSSSSSSDVSDEDSQSEASTTDIISRIELELDEATTLADSGKKPKQQLQHLRGLTQQLGRSPDHSDESIRQLITKLKKLPDPKKFSKSKFGSAAQEIFELIEVVNAGRRKPKTPQVITMTPRSTHPRAADIGSISPPTLDVSLTKLDPIGAPLARTTTAMMQGCSPDSGLQKALFDLQSSLGQAQMESALKTALLNS
jgi:hypothetical protein